MLISVLIARANLLDIAPAPPITVAAAETRCAGGTDAGATKFNEAFAKHSEEMEKRAQALATQTTPPSGAEAMLMAPTLEEMQQAQAIEVALAAVRASVASFDEGRRAALDAAREKSTCKEGNSACLPAWQTQVRQVQVSALEKHAKRYLALWSAAREAIEKHAKLMAPRTAKLAKAKSALARNSVDVMTAMTAQAAKTLTEVSSEGCTAMTRFDE